MFYYFKNFNCFWWYENKLFHVHLKKSRIIYQTRKHLSFSFLSSPDSIPPPPPPPQRLNVLRHNFDVLKSDWIMIDCKNANCFTRDWHNDL